MNSNSMPDEHFLSAFLDATMPAQEFNHNGHLRAAWLLLQRLPREDAVQATCDGIARLAARLGAPGKFHRTLTEALVRLMAHRGGSDRALSWPAFLAANEALIHDAKGLLARHYSEALLSSQAARERFVSPDRLALPS